MARAAASDPEKAAKLLANAKTKDVPEVTEMLRAAGMDKGAISEAKQSMGKYRMYPVRKDGNGFLSHVGDSKVPEHLKKLRIPPAWKDVRVNPNEDAALVATGLDEKGRRQAIYSASHGREAAASSSRR